MKNSFLQITLMILFIVAFQVITVSQIHLATTPAGYNVLRFQNTNGNILLSGMTSFSAITSSANNNIALGTGSLSSIVSAEANIAVGPFALEAITTGDDNIAIGEDALRYSLAERNIAIGTDVLKNNTANDNTGIGHQSLQYHQIGYNNTGIGFRSARNLNSGIENVAIGSEALYNLTSGNANTAIGSNAGSTSTADTRCVYIGYNSRNSTSQGIENSMALGNESTVASSNTVRIGNNLVESIGGQVPWTVTSDRNAKTNILENVPGLNFINKLRPVTFQFDRIKIGHIEDSSITALSPVMSGFIAQEVDSILHEVSFECTIVDTPSSSNDLYGIRYAELVVPLVKAVQELNARLEKLELEILELRSQ